jgi:microcystin-dependent protein
MKKTKLLFVLLLFSKLALAQQPYIGELRLFAGNFAPQGWAYCDGSLLSIGEYETLFQLIGTTYGGDGQSTFALPDLRGRVPMGIGQGPGLTSRTIGESGGTETILNTANIPAHSHTARLVVQNGNATTHTPTASSSIATSGNFSGRSFIPNLSYTTNAPDMVNQSFTTSSVGTSTPITLRPVLGINYIISLYGIFPSPN